MSVKLQNVNVYGLIGAKGRSTTQGGPGWVAILNAPSRLWPRAIRFDPNDNLIIAGRHDESTVIRGWVAKFDPHGQSLWSKYTNAAQTNMNTTNILGTTRDDDGNIYACGYTLIGDSQFYLVKYDPAGNVMWERILEGDRSDVMHAIDHHGGAIFVLGDSNSTGGSGKRDLVLVRYDRSGTVDWQIGLGRSTDERGRGVAATDTAVFVVGQRDTDALAARFDHQGEIGWQKRLTMTGETIFYACAITDTALYAVGSTVSGPGDNNAMLVKYDHDGNLLWQRILSTTGHESYFYAVAIHGDQIVPVGSLKQVSAGFENALIAAYDANGNLRWQNQLIEQSVDTAAYAVISNQHDMFVTGYTGNDAFLTKLPVDGSQHGLYGNISYEVATLQDQIGTGMASDAGLSRRVRTYAEGSRTGLRGDVPLTATVHLG